VTVQSGGIRNPRAQWGGGGEKLVMVKARAVVTEISSSWGLKLRTAERGGGRAIEGAARKKNRQKISHLGRAENLEGVRSE